MAIKRGFSLIELIIVIGLLSLLSLAISGVMLTSIASNMRLRTATRIKQAGSYVVDQTQTLVRNSLKIACDQTNGTVTTTNPDGQTTTLATATDSLGNTRIASSGAYLTPDQTKTSLFSLTCDDDLTPTLVKLSFNLQDTRATSTIESPSLHFETAISVRNQ